jgi:LemA protein
MSRWLIPIGAIALVVAIIAIAVVTTYNGLVNRSTEVDNQWAQVQVQLQRRFDLIPNLVESVKGIFEQEQEVFGRLADARTRYAGAVQSGDASAQVQAATELESALARLLVVVENYPQLRSQANVTQLMDELAGTENRISIARQRFNDATTDYNRTVRRFPSNTVAGAFNFEQRPLFESVPDSATPPAVRF